MKTEFWPRAMYGREREEQTGEVLRVFKQWCRYPCKPDNDETGDSDIAGSIGFMNERRGTDDATATSSLQRVTLSGASTPPAWDRITSDCNGSKPTAFVYGLQNTCEHNNRWLSPCFFCVKATERNAWTCRPSANPLV